MGHILRLSEQDIRNKKLSEFYEVIGKELNVDISTIQYDCRKILISKEIQDYIYYSYHILYPELSKRDPLELKAYVTAILLTHGPKVSEGLKGYEVEILEGFI